MTDERPSAGRDGSRFVKLMGVDVHMINEGPNDPADTLLNGSPLTVIVLPAQWLSAASFDRWAAVVAQRHRVIRIDLPGHGLTGPFNDNDYSPQHYAELVTAIIKGVAPGPYVMVGSSFSGIVAAIHAAGAPPDLRGLVLATSSGLPRPENAPKPNAPPPDPAWADESVPRPRAFYDWKLGTLLRRPMDDAAYDMLLDEVAATNELPGRVAEAQQRLLHHDPEALTQALRRLKVPVLVQWSSESTYLPAEMAERIAELVPGTACVRHYHDTGHLLLIDAPEDCARDLLLFLETLVFMEKTA